MASNSPHANAVESDAGYEQKAATNENAPSKYFF